MRGRGGPYLIPEDRDTNLSLLVDPRVVDPRLKLYLQVVADKESEGIDMVQRVR